jgi:hypothetical protein
MPPTITAADFLTAFRARRAYCRALLDLSAEQAALIAADEYSDLIALLTQKQQLLDALADAGRKPVDLWRAWQSERGQLTDSQRQECERTLAETESLLQELTQAEQSSTELLMSRRDATEQALGAVNRGGAAHAEYGSLSNAVRSRRLDVGT